VSQRRAYYRARVARDSISFWLMSGWDLDGETNPTASFVTVVWLKPTRPSALPVGYTTCGGLWQ
jgi:hypothetical protein